MAFREVGQAKVGFQLRVRAASSWCEQTSATTRPASVAQGGSIDSSNPACRPTVRPSFRCWQLHSAAADQQRRKREKKKKKRVDGSSRVVEVEKKRLMQAAPTRRETFLSPRIKMMIVKMVKFLTRHATPRHTG